MFRLTRFLLTSSASKTRTTRTTSPTEALRELHRVSDINKLPQKIKPTTRLVGVPVQARWRQMTITLCAKIQNKLAQDIPQGVFYRSATENNVRFIQRVCEEHDDYELVEDILDRGQIEQVIMMLEDELQLIDLMKEWKPWEVSRRDLNETKHDMKNGEDFQFPKGMYRVPEDEMTWKTTKGVRKLEDLEWTPAQLKEIAEAQEAKERALHEAREKEKAATV
uniref:Uncharacterized protein n=1 Tax=Percolomonas cosmopolitus TaxID=63605 RepID=A0A7S1PJ08_9EUKA|eukprot:CAMPEP_0117451082 /NCGR_PEP_ID=MMETSP0759-20121206/8814_1 /TAXON_ID=63605 /ORGANISM="Percolomonas cosmopolitus, Strain WS" /LENGTH=221 /DNA_ID=CAMNT_0005243651 /DNA_START=39 /DNA_END=704 /DNA_ORIENTATION=+